MNMDILMREVTVLCHMKWYKMPENHEKIPRKCWIFQINSSILKIAAVLWAVECEQQP